MFTKLHSTMLVCCLLLICAAAAFGQTPAYQPIPAGPFLASGMADASGTAGLAGVEYWVWDGGNSYFYYTYKIYNVAFTPFIKHLTIGNPTGEPYVVTGSSGGGPVGGTPWSYATWASLPTVIDWVSSTAGAVIYPGQTSWDTQYFQFASKKGPSSAALTVREGDLTSYAKGLIPAPGGITEPRSTGYWKHQFSGKGTRKEAASLPGYLDAIAAYSKVFAPGLAGTISSDLAFGTSTLEVADNSVMIQKAKEQLFGLWLNIVSQKLNYYAPATFDPTQVTTTATTVGDAVKQIENTILDPNATTEQLENVKDIAESLNVQ